MAFKIVRNDITKMNTEAIVNTANDHATAGTGCDSAVYKSAGYDELLAYRTEKIGFVPEGNAFITPGFKLQAKYIRINYGPVLENITYTYARSHDYSVSVGRIGKLECDYILRDYDMKYSYVQVSYTLVKNGFAEHVMVNERIRSYKLSDFTNDYEKELTEHVSAKRT